MKLAFKEILHQKRKYLLIEIVIFLLMFMVLFLQGLTLGLGQATTAAIQHIDAKNFVMSDSAEDLLTISHLDNETTDKILDTAGTQAAALDVMRLYVQKEGSKDKLDITYFSVDPSSFLAPEVFEGETLDEAARESQTRPLVLDDAYKDDGIKVGDTLKDSTSGMTFTVAGFTKDAMYGHISVAYIAKSDYDALMTKLNPMYQSYTHAIAYQGDAKDIEALNLKNIEIVPKETVISKVPGYSAENVTITMITWVLVIVSAAIIGVFSYIINLQKQREFGVMKAIGVGMGKITRFILSEILIISGVGALLALAATFGMASALPASMPFYLDPVAAVEISAAFVLISMVASLLSVVQVAKVDPLTVIGAE